MARGRAVNGAGTIITHKGRRKPYQIQFTVDGVRKSGGYYASYPEASAALRDLTSQVDKQEYIEPQKMTVAQWLDIWLDTYTKHIKPGTLIQYRGYVKNHIVPAIGKIQLCKLQPHHIQGMVNSLKYQGRKKDGEISAKTRKNVHGCISAALYKAVEIKYLKDNPATGCTIPRDETETNEEIHPFTTDELNAFLQAIETARFKDIYNFALNTGMRLSEILGLSWSKVDFSRNKITVDSQLLMLRERGGKRSPGQTKNSKTRSFKVAPQVITLLNSVKKKQAANKLKAGEVWNNEYDLVFTDEIGGTIPHSSVEHEFKLIVKGIEADYHRFHDLRHTFATLAIQNGADIKTLSEALGHYSVAFTLDIYGHVSEEMQDNFADIMNTIIASR